MKNAPRVVMTMLLPALLAAAPAGELVVRDFTPTVDAAALGAPVSLAFPAASGPIAVLCVEEADATCKPLAEALLPAGSRRILRVVDSPPLPATRTPAYLLVEGRAGVTGDLAYVSGARRTPLTLAQAVKRFPEVNTLLQKYPLPETPAEKLGAWRLWNAPDAASFEFLLRAIEGKEPPEISLNPEVLRAFARAHRLHPELFEGKEARVKAALAGPLSKNSSFQDAASAIYLKTRVLGDPDGAKALLPKTPKGVLYGIPWELALRALDQIPLSSLPPLERMESARHPAVSPGASLTPAELTGIAALAKTDVEAAWWKYRAMSNGPATLGVHVAGSGQTGVNVMPPNAPPAGTAAPIVITVSLVNPSKKPVTLEVTGARFTAGTTAVSLAPKTPATLVVPAMGELVASIESAASIAVPMSAGAGKMEVDFRSAGKTATASFDWNVARFH